MRRHHGFTLIEVMIVVGIIGILSAIAIPSYSEYIMRARITDAVGGLSTMRVRMEQYFQDNRKYDGTPPACDPSSIAPKPADTDYFAYTCAVGASTYTVTATGKAAMLGFIYTIDQLNAHGSTVPTAKGWLNQACGWVLKKDGSC